MRWWTTMGLGVALSACGPGLAELTYTDRYERAQVLCEGVPVGASPLEELDVVATRRIAGFEGRPRLHRTRGVRLFVRARPGWTTARLERWTDCRIERMALLLPEERAPSDPLAVEGVDADVRPAEGGWEVRLTGPRSDVGAELVRRAVDLVD